MSLQQKHRTIVIIFALGLILLGSGLYFYPFFRVQGAALPANPVRSNLASNRNLTQPTIDDWSNAFSPRGLSWDVNTIAVSGSDVYAGGEFIVAGNTEAHYIARYNLTAKAWYPLGDGVEDAVFAILIDGDNIYAGGTGFVSRWNTTSQSWTLLGNINGTVRALALSGNDLYAAGSFDFLSSESGGSAYADNIAHLNLTSGGWTAMGSGANGVVFSMVINGTSLYAGGSFTQAGGVSDTACVAVWNTATHQWGSLGAFPNDGTVYALSMDGSELLAAGSFNSPSINPVYSWDGSWEDMGTVNVDEIFAINVNPNGIYIAGGENIWRWSGISWEKVGTDISSPTTLAVNSMAYADSHLYIGGTFTSAGDVTAFRAADFKLTDTTWHPLFDESGPGGNGLDGDVHAVLIDGDDVYVGGEFYRAGTIAAKYIAKWDGTTWSALGGTGIKNGEVNALALQGDTLYVGGNFSNFNDDTDAHYIATYNTTSQTWAPLVSGGKEGVAGGNVLSLAVNGNQVYVGGSFIGVGFGAIPGSYTQHFAIWNSNTNTWTTQTDARLNSSVDALAVHDTDVYLGGRFYGSGLEGLARWNTTAITTTAVSGVSANVYALAVSGDDLYVGGTFTGRIKRLDTTTNTWLPMSGSVFENTYGGIVYALAAHADGVIYVGGNFTQAGGWKTNNLARYIPQCDMWLPVGQQGVNARVLALGVGSTQVYSGGEFSLAYPVGDNLPSVRLASFNHLPVHCSRSYLPVLEKPNP
jgi:trimeric autotransporter adhesin